MEEDEWGGYLYWNKELTEEKRVANSAVKSPLDCAVKNLLPLLTECQTDLDQI